MKIKLREFLSVVLSFAILLPSLFWGGGIAIAQVPDNITVSGATGTAGTFKIGNVISVTVDTSAEIGVLVDFSQFGGTTPMPATNTAPGVYFAQYTIAPGDIDGSGIVSISVDGDDPQADDDSFLVDNIAPLSTGKGSLSIIKNNLGDSAIAGIGDQVSFTADTLDSADEETWTANLASPNNLTGDSALPSGSNSAPALENNLVGTYSFDVIGTDNAGNITPIANGTNAIEVDTKRPQIVEAKLTSADTIEAKFDEAISAASLSASYFTVTNPDRAVTAAVPGISADRVDLSINPGLLESDTPMLGLVNDEGTVFDPAGNLANPAEIQVTDGTAPSLPVVTDPSLPIIVNADATVIAGTADNDSNVNIYTDPNNDGDKSDGTKVATTIAENGNFAVSVGLAQNVVNNFLVTSSDNSGNESEEVDVPTITEDSTGPVPPEQFTVTRNGDDIDLSWSSSDGAVNYEVWRSSSPYVLLATLPNTALSYKDEGVTKGTKYYYKVIAIDSLGNKSESSELSITIPVDQAASTSTSSSSVPIVTASFASAVESVEEPVEQVTQAPAVVRASSTPEPSSTPEVKGSQTEENEQGESWWLLIIPVALVLVIGAALPLTAATAISVPIIGAVVALILSAFTSGDIKTAYMYLILGGETILLLLINYGLLSGGSGVAVEEEAKPETVKTRKKSKKNKKRK